VLFSAICGVVAPARGAWPARVVVLHGESDAVVNEALVRVRGELAAVGLVVEVAEVARPAAAEPPALADDVYGALVFEQRGTRVRIKAYGPGSSVAVEQEVDLSDPSLDAEVLAVRAVEALRAAMLEYARMARARNQAVPNPVTGFTKLEDHPLEGPPPKPVRRRPFRLWAGATAALEPAQAGASFGARGSFFVAPDWYVAGLSVSASLSPARVEQDPGRVDVSQRAATAHLGGTLPITGASEGFVTLGAGIASFSVVGEPAPGYVGRDAHHLSPSFSLEAGAVHWLLGDVGVYSLFGAGYVTDAPVVRIDGSDVARIGRPTLTFSAGVGARL
jgi:hypothetical protein